MRKIIFLFIVCFAGIAFGAITINGIERVTATAGDATTLNGHADTYFGTASDVSVLQSKSNYWNSGGSASGRVTQVESKTSTWNNAVTDLGTVSNSVNTLNNQTNGIVTTNETSPVNWSGVPSMQLTTNDMYWVRSDGGTNRHRIVSNGIEEWSVTPLGGGTYAVVMAINTNGKVEIGGNAEFTSQSLFVKNGIESSQTIFVTGGGISLSGTAYLTTGSAVPLALAQNNRKMLILGTNQTRIEVAMTNATLPYCFAIGKEATNATMALDVNGSANVSSNITLTAKDTVLPLFAVTNCSISASNEAGVAKLWVYDGSGVGTKLTP